MSPPIPCPPFKRVDKPWGHEEWLVVGERVVMKRLVIHQGHRLSLQYHEKKEEAWLLVRGRARVRYGEAEGEIAAGRVVYLPAGTVHRIEAIEEVELLEVSTPELDDVVRLEDDFGRQERP
ncbi:MAG: phosphomannose isomerase type II C-terminal cupin domain [Acidobacteriota bacterium]|nr:phosphomannose isomerase type II C-terminal cupin domain [Acidobacteriota bacterium]